MSIPMGMSYALLANLPAVYGLYTSLIPPVMYLLFGTCNQLSLGVRCVFDFVFVFFVVSGDDVLLFGRVGWFAHFG